jgi:hypothetical protein
MLVSIAFGAVIYTAALYLLWRLAQKPDGAEKFCLTQAERMMEKFGFRINLLGN